MTAMEPETFCVTSIDSLPLFFPPFTPRGFLGMTGNTDSHRVLVPIWQPLVLVSSTQDNVSETHSCPRARIPILLPVLGSDCLYSPGEKQKTWGEESQHQHADELFAQSCLLMMVCPLLGVVMSQKAPGDMRGWQKILMK